MELLVIGTLCDFVFIQLENRVKSGKVWGTSLHIQCVEWKPAIEDTVAEHRQDELKKFLQHGSCLKIGGRNIVSIVQLQTRTAVNETVAEQLFLFEAEHLFDHTQNLFGFPTSLKGDQKTKRKGHPRVCAGSAMFPPTLLFTACFKCIIEALVGECVLYVQLVNLDTLLKPPEVQTMYLIVTGMYMY